MLSTTVVSPQVLISTIVTGIFHDRASADLGWNAAIARGYSASDISVAVSDDIHKKHFIVQRQATENKALEGAAVGGIIGSTVGTIAVVLAVGVSILLPTLGLVIAGPIVAAFAGAGAGAAVGGIIGGLAGLGIPEKHVKLIEDHIRKGHIVLTLKARSAADAELIRGDWKKSAVEVLF